MQNITCTEICAVCSVFTIFTIQYVHVRLVCDGWRSMSSLYHSLQVLFHSISKPFTSLSHSIMDSQNFHAFRTVHITHWKCWKAPARMHSNWWTLELKFLYIFHFNFKHSSFTFNRMPSTTIVLYGYARDATKNHESESILQKFIFCLLSPIFFYRTRICFSRFLHIKNYTLCALSFVESAPPPFLHTTCTRTILIPLRITFVIPLLPFTETMTWLHNMQSTRRMDKPCECVLELHTS